MWTTNDPAHYLFTGGAGFYNGGVCGSDLALNPAVIVNNTGDDSFQHNLYYQNYGILIDSGQQSPYKTITLNSENFENNLGDIIYATNHNESANESQRF